MISFSEVGYTISFLATLLRTKQNENKNYFLYIVTTLKRAEKY